MSSFQPNIMLRKFEKFGVTVKRLNGTGGSKSSKIVRIPT